MLRHIRLGCQKVYGALRHLTTPASTQMLHLHAWPSYSTGENPGTENTVMTISFWTDRSLANSADPDQTAHRGAV